MAKKKKKVSRRARGRVSRVRAVRVSSSASQEVHPTRRKLYFVFYNTLFFAFLALLSFLITVAINATSAWSLIFSYFGILMSVIAFGFFLAWLVLLILWWTRKNK